MTNKSTRKTLCIIEGRTARLHVEAVDERHGAPGPSVLIESRAKEGWVVGGWNLALPEAKEIAEAILAHCKQDSAA